ncbi:MAG TPA: hypothetical protein VHH73_00480 [Verrucomicrobiae bacterium]|nr:hypothetical protein [Verrucomicrobiae bacterium]
MTVGMSTRLALAVCLLLFAGCGKHSGTTPGPPSNNLSASKSEADPPVFDPAAPAPDDAQMEIVLASLTQAVRKFGVEQRRAPGTLAEVVAQGYLTAIPPAPPGKRFVISRQLQVTLDKQ